MQQEPECRFPGGTRVARDGKQEKRRRRSPAHREHVARRMDGRDLAHRVQVAAEGRKRIDRHDQVGASRDAEYRGTLGSKWDAGDLVHAIVTGNRK